MNLATHVVGAGGVIFNEEGKVLLVKNPRKGWEYPGGMVEQGETVAQGLIREIKEESGVDVEIVNLVGVYSNTKKKKGYNGVKEIPTIVTIDFICKYIGGKLTTSEESLEVKWFSIEEALKIINQKQIYRFKNALEYKKHLYLSGYEVNSDNELEVKEEYIFIR